MEANFKNTLICFIVALSVFVIFQRWDIHDARKSNEYFYKAQDYWHVQYDLKCRELDAKKFSGMDSRLP